MKITRILATVAALALCSPLAAAAPLAWQNKALNADARANLLVGAMTTDEKLLLVTSYYGTQVAWNEYRDPGARRQSAGFVPGVPRLNFTPQWQTDAGSGVATQGVAVPDLQRTALPAGILTASTWNPDLAVRGGAMIGAEARASGFNTMLAGGVDLLREPGNGRNFEYGGEDPLLAGTMVGAIVRGIQSNQIITTIKHFAFNDQERRRTTVNILIDEPSARMSDLLAFQIAIEQSSPGSIMCSYNLVNGEWACQNDWLLNKVLKHDWGYKGFVMSDWGAMHDTVKNALNGLDQEAGVQKPADYVYRDKLKAAIADGRVPMAVLDDKVRRIARVLIESGAADNPPTPDNRIPYAAHEAVSQADAEEGIVLLKNDGHILPLAGTARRIAIIGGHADVGVLTGGGSAQVYPRGGSAVHGEGPKSWPGPIVYAPSSPLKALKAERPGARISWADGSDPAAAATVASKADVAIVFVTQWTAESLDFPLTLPDNQDALVDAVARANPNTVVVLQTGGPVLMPWIDRVRGAVEAWYPGSKGGEAIARILTGKVNPSGHLPATFGRAASDWPRAEIDGLNRGEKEIFDVRFSEGAAVGYKWFDKNGTRPLFPFGHGLSYTSFQQSGLSAGVKRGTIVASFTVRNTGSVAGKHVAQIYVSPAAGGWEAPKRLGAFTKLTLAPGRASSATVTIDPRLLGMWDSARPGWKVAAGKYRVTLASSAADRGTSVIVTMPERHLPAGAGVAK
ncbi:beta-glucosidase [Sphingomonas crusticola]|uniref:beta-glucosidase n=1 Tax=Sphingomonas crusticola TaxID=1697973 RepID=UPI000E227E5A|nr:glycoside hydrolase family 3 C-terminal domain-containing protein [Sphingomonas crusticola]